MLCVHPLLRGAPSVINASLIHPPSSYLTSLSCIIFKNIAHVWSLSLSLPERSKGVKDGVKRAQTRTSSIYIFIAGQYLNLCIGEDFLFECSVFVSV